MYIMILPSTMYEKQKTTESSNVAKWLFQNRGRKEGRKEGRKGRKQGSKEGRKEGRKDKQDRPIRLSIGLIKKEGM